LDSEVLKFYAVMDTQISSLLIYSFSCDLVERECHEFFHKL